MTAPRVVVDPLFDGAVARDLAGRATEDDIALLHEDPWTWRKMLGVRANILQTIAAPSVSTVDVADSDGRAWSFRAMVRGMTSARRQALMVDIQRRIVVADKVKRDLAEEQSSHRAGHLSAIVQGAVGLVPRTTPEGAAWHAEVVAYCERFRGAAPFTARTK